MPRLAFDPDGSVHQLHQARADGQAQPGAAEAPGGGPIGLGKGTKQLGLLFLGQSDAGILDLKTSSTRSP